MSQRKARDLTGKTFARWTIIAPGGRTQNRLSMQIAQCACGSVREVLTFHLENGTSKSCGCYQRQIAKGQLDAAYGLLEMARQ